MKLFEKLTRSEIEEIPPWPQQAETIRLLMVDDDEDEYRLLSDTLRDIRGTTFELEWVATFGEGLAAILENRHHLCFVDYRLGATDGIDLVRQARAAGSQAPLVMLTGAGSRTVDMEAMAAGATDFLDKGKTPPALLERTIRYAITQAAMTEQLRRTLAQVSGVEELGRLLAEQGPAPEALDRVVGLVVEAFDAVASSVYLMEGGWLRLAAVRGYPHALTEVDPNSGRLARVIQGGRPQIIPNITVDPDHRTDATPPELCLPLFAEGQCWGTLHAAARGEAGVDAEMERGLRLVADRLAVALALNRAIRGRGFVAG